MRLQMRPRSCKRCLNSTTHVHAFQCSQAYAPIKSKPQLPPGQTPGIWLCSVPGEWGICFVRPSRGWEFDFCLAVVALNWTGSVSFQFFFSVAEPLTAMNTCFDEMEYTKGRDIAFVSDLAYKKKVFKSCVVFLKVCMKSRECLNINDFR